VRWARTENGADYIGGGDQKGEVSFGQTRLKKEEGERKDGYCTSQSIYRRTGHLNGSHIRRDKKETTGCGQKRGGANSMLHKRKGYGDGDSQTHGKCSNIGVEGRSTRVKSFAGREKHKEKHAEDTRASKTQGRLFKGEKSKKDKKKAGREFREGSESGKAKAKVRAWKGGVKPGTWGRDIVGTSNLGEKR